MDDILERREDGPEGTTVPRERWEFGIHVSDEHL